MSNASQEFNDWAKPYETIVASAARKYASAAEYDDLYQEGMIALWRVYPSPDPKVVTTAVHNRMKNWVRYTKKLNYHQAASYEEILNDGV